MVPFILSRSLESHSLRFTFSVIFSVERYQQTPPALGLKLAIVEDRIEDNEMNKVVG